MEMHLKPIVKGALSFVPGLAHRLDQKTTGGTDSATYCYGVWLKHLTFLWAHGLRQLPSTVAELGPGDSMGIGLAAVLSGASRYYALDVVAHTNATATLRIFDQLVELLRARAPRPGKGWPDYDHLLGGTLFPSHILTDEHLTACLAPERVASIRQAITDPEGRSDDGSIVVRYVVPWSDPSIIVVDSIDLALSHSVLEHVDDLDRTYAALHQWLKPGAVMSHQVDYSGHGMSRQWNGYRTCPDWLWYVLRGRRHYLINREPHSAHMARIRALNFEVICEMCDHRRGNSVDRTQLAPRWSSLSDEDLSCSQAFVQAIKRPAAVPAAV